MVRFIMTELVLWRMELLQTGTAHEEQFSSTDHIQAKQFNIFNIIKLFELPPKM